MKTVALISGGKDSCFNMMCCVAEGHQMVALANLRPKDKDELDSYMYQTVGHHAIYLYAEAMELPLYSRVIEGSSVCTERDYSPQSEDEVEDLYELLSDIKSKHDIEAVSVGAILSDYQRVRVEHVCQRLGLKVLAFLWRRDQEELLKEMIACDVKAIIIKVAAMGLLPKAHLGMELSEILPHMIKKKEEIGLNVCGEGGEFETFVLDCPLFKKSIVIDEKECVTHSEDAFAPVAYLNLRKCHLEPKAVDDGLTLKQRVLSLPITTSLSWLERHLTSAVSMMHLEAPNWDDCYVDTEEKVSEQSRDKDLDGLPPLKHSDGVNFQISGIRGQVSDSIDVMAATKCAMDSLIGCLEGLGHTAAEIVSVSLYVRELANFAAINSVYCTYFKNNPPVRLCIQACLPDGVALQLDCQGRRSTDGDRLTMHVQGLSHWAPANIGPYSQAVLTGGKLFVAGIVPLLPSNLSVIMGGIIAQCKMSLLFVEEVLAAMVSSCMLTSCPLVVCFVTKCEYVAVAKEMWTFCLKDREHENEGDETIKMSPQFQYCVVPKLPKDVMVEWQVYAWPSCHGRDDINCEKLFQKHALYTVTLEARAYEELFSCRISAVSNDDSLDLRMTDIEKLASDVLTPYSSLQESFDFDFKAAPLAKIFFPISKFTSSQLEMAFSKEMLKFGAGHFPVVSFVPVLQLDTKQHLLAWCQ